MTAAHRLKGVGWFASCVVVVLGFYLVSLQVASERGKLEAVNRQIGDAERDVRALETEFETRANLTQLEKWNGDTLALTAPVAGQFVADTAALASIDVTAGPAAGPDGQPVRTAALLVPSYAGAPDPKPVIATTPHSRAALLRAVAVANVRPQAVAMLDDKLLSDSTLGAILSGARTESRRR